MTLLYDGSLEGFFTAVFEANRTGGPGTRIRCINGYEAELFEETLNLRTQPDEARRVLRGIVRRLEKQGLNLITRAFLSEVDGCEDSVHRFIRKGMKDGKIFIDDLTDEDSLRVMQMSQKTGKEYHRFLGLIRFRKLSTGEYYAAFEPDTNLLPLLGRHFASRFPDQAWMIHDKKRNNALVHIRGGLEIINFNAPETLPELAVKEIDCAEERDPYSKLWKTYHNKIGIEGRANTKLQMQFMPKKHWKYLPEMD